MKVTVCDRCGKILYDKGKVGTITAKDPFNTKDYLINDLCKDCMDSFGLWVEKKAIQLKSQATVEIEQSKPINFGEPRTIRGFKE